METVTPSSDRSSDRRDAFAAAIALLLLGALWVVLRLYWQGALLLAVGVGLGYLGWFRFRTDNPVEPSTAESPVSSEKAEKSAKAKRSRGRKRKR